MSRMIVSRERLANGKLKITVEVDPRWLRFLPTAIFLIILAVTAVTTLPFSYTVGSSGIEASHVFGSNYFPNMGYQYGLDTVFSYGPLGYIMHPEAIANDIAIASVVRASVWLILLVHLFLLGRTGSRGLWKSLALMAALFTVRIHFMLYTFDYLILTALFVVVIYMLERPGGWTGHLLLIYIVGLLSLMKFSAYIMSIPTAGLYVVARAGWPPRLLAWKDRLLPVGIVVAAPIAFFSCHALSWAAFWRYIVGSLSVSDGYSEAMSLPTGTRDATIAIILVALLLLGLIYAIVKRALPWTVGAVLAALYWMSFKHGFVRSDDHVILSYSYGVIVAAGLFCMVESRRETLKYLAGLACFVLIALVGINRHWPVWSLEYWSPHNQIVTARNLIHWDRTIDQLQRAPQNNGPFRLLPQQFQDRLEASTTTIFPIELAYASTLQFRLDPLYVMQSYSSYTHYLDSLTAARIRKHYGRINYILFNWDSIDDRHPLLDVPATWQAMYDDYQPELQEGNTLLLVPRKQPLEHDETSLMRLPVPFRHWVELPWTNAILWSKIQIPYSYQGRCLKFLYKTPALWLTVGAESGSETKFRVIPDVLNTPFPINTLPVDFDSLLALWQSGRVDSRVVRIRLDTDAPQDYREPTMELSAETRTNIVFAPPQSTSFQNVFHLASPSDIQQQATASIDMINRVLLNPFPDNRNPRDTRAGSDVEIVGWGATAADGRPFDAVYGVVHERMVRASKAPRPDVADYLKNGALTDAGFRLNLTSGELGTGTVKVVLFGVLGKERALYRIGDPVYLNIR